MLKSLGNYDFKIINNNEIIRENIQSLDKRINEAYYTMCRCKSQAHNLSESWKGLKADKESISFATQIQGGAIFESFQVAMDNIKSEYNEAKKIYTEANLEKEKLLSSTLNEEEINNSIHSETLDNAIQYYFETNNLDAIETYINNNVTTLESLQDIYEELNYMLVDYIGNEEDLKRLEDIFNSKADQLED